jgi:hypothetical protein
VADVGEAVQPLPPAEGELAEGVRLKVIVFQVTMKLVNWVPGACDESYVNCPNVGMRPLPVKLML